MAREILAATTSAVATSEVQLSDHSELPVSISANGLAGAETVTLQFHNGVAWADYYKDGNASPERITTTNSMLTIWAVGRWRGNKSATAGATSVHVHDKYSL